MLSETWLAAKKPVLNAHLEKPYFCRRILDRERVSKNVSKSLRNVLAQKSYSLKFPERT